MQNNHKKFKKYLNNIDLYKNRIINFRKGEKLEKANTSFNYYNEKKKIQTFLASEKKLIFYFKFISRKKYFEIWDNERKLIYFFHQYKYSGIMLSQKFFIHIEELLSNNNIHIQNIQMKKNSPQIMELILKGLKSYLSIQQVLLYISLKKFKLEVNRFYLRKKLSINPNYICWPKKKNLKLFFNVLLHKNNENFKSYINIFSLLSKVKPGLLKIAYFGISSFVFFSIDAGFFINCPISFKKKLKKKKLYSS